MSITNQIEKTISATIKGTRGAQIANLYHKYAMLINSMIVCAIGLWLYIIISLLLGSLGFIFGFIVAWMWIYINIVGPLAHFWGFDTQKQKEIPKLPLKPKSEWKKAEKKTIVQYRDVQSNTEKIETSEGPKYAEQGKDVVMLDSSGKEVPIKKEELEATYTPIGEDEKV